MLSNARAQPPIQSWVRITDIFFQNLQEIMIGGTTPQAGMNKAAAEIDKVLK